MFDPRAAGGIRLTALGHGLDAFEEIIGAPQPGLDLQLLAGGSPRLPASTGGTVCWAASLTLRACGCRLFPPTVSPICLAVHGASRGPPPPFGRSQKEAPRKAGQGCAN